MISAELQTPLLCLPLHIDNPSRNQTTAARSIIPERRPEVADFYVRSPSCRTPRKETEFDTDPIQTGMMRASVGSGAGFALSTDMIENLQVPSQ